MHEADPVAGAVLLIVDDDELVRRSVARAVRRWGFRAIEAASAEEAADRLRSERIDVALLDMQLPGISGLELLHRLPRLQPGVVPVMITGHGDVTLANRALEAGAHAYFSKPIEDWKGFGRALRQAASLAHPSLEAPETVESPLLGRSEGMTRLREQVAQLAPSAASLCILGESGTGKELVARELHRRSGRHGAFVAINCAAIPEALIESELFGHVRGAHSTATEDRPGLLMAADEGTLLLDEIADMPLELQAKLLRVLEDRTYRPVGGSREYPLTARVLAASHKDLREAVGEGRFRRDLLFRLDVVTLQVPALRERPDDVPLLVYRFVEAFGRSERRNVQHVSQEALTALAEHPWPGNVRELRNAVHRAVLMSTGDTVQLGDLPKALREPRRERPTPSEGAARPVPAGRGGYEALYPMTYADAKEVVLREFSEAYLGHLMETTSTVTEAAEHAGMARPNLSRLLKRFGLSGRS